MKMQLTKNNLNQKTVKYLEGLGWGWEGSVGQDGFLIVEGKGFSRERGKRLLLLLLLTLTLLTRKLLTLSLSLPSRLSLSLLSSLSALSESGALSVVVDAVAESLGQESDNNDQQAKLKINTNCKINSISN